MKHNGMVTVKLTFQNMQQIVVIRLAKQRSAFKEVFSSMDLLGYVPLLGRNLVCSDKLSILGYCTVHVFPFTQLYVRLVTIFNHENHMYKSSNVHAVTSEK
jgi:hypothetical protein